MASLESMTKSPLLNLSSALFLVVCSLFLRRILLSPLRRIPGPFVTRCSSLWLLYHSYVGDECRAIQRLHRQYGPVVRVAPNDVDIADADAIAPIYVTKGGFLKSSYYEAFNVDGHATIFTTPDPSRRAKRVKAVAQLFSMSSVRNGQHGIQACANRMVTRMREEAGSGRPVNVLNLARALAMDVVSTYLLGECFGGLDEKSKKFSGFEFVGFFVSAGRFFYLPHEVVGWIEWVVDKLFPRTAAQRSIAKVDEFLAVTTSTSTAKAGTFAARLLSRDIDQSESTAQCKDLLFAGSDSVATSFATICYHLVINPEKYQKLRNEVLASSSTDLMQLPYLNCVVREGLRIALANPIRLSRVVPPSGWTHNDHFIPAGVNVGVSSYELHMNTVVFPNPSSFVPERWFNPTEEMQKSYIPFGAGTRQCIARNLATVELTVAMRTLIQQDVLSGARTVDQIRLKEWFNAKVVGEKIELIWPRTV